MITELGHFALVLAFGVALVQMVVPMWGAWRGRAAWMAMADPAAAALSHYRRAFDDAALDGAMREVLAQAPSAQDAPWAMIFPQQRIRREPGVGKRNDMIYWGCLLYTSAAADE